LRVLLGLAPLQAGYLANAPHGRTLGRRRFPHDQPFLVCPCTLAFHPERVASKALRSTRNACQFAHYSWSKLRRPRDSLRGRGRARDLADQSCAAPTRGRRSRRTGVTCGEPHSFPHRVVALQRAEWLLPRIRAIVPYSQAIRYQLKQNHFLFVPETSS
jgi:hypothetical protein